MTAAELRGPRRWSEASRRGRSFLATELGDRGLPSALLAVDRSFRHSLTTPVTRGEVTEVLGLDPGLDFGEEAFSEMLALNHLPVSWPGVATLVAQVCRARLGYRYRYFPEMPDFAADTDCTAVAVSGLYRHGVLTGIQLKMFAAELLVAATPEGPHAGVTMVYWEDDAEPDAPARGRKYDPVVCANVLHVLHLAHGHPADLAVPTLGYVRDHLVSGRFWAGTRYYPSPDVFLHAVARLCAGCGVCADLFGSPLRRALASERRGGPPEHALDLALRTLAADHLGLRAGQPTLRDLLTATQLPDGSWPASAYFRLGRSPIYVGSPHLTTLFAAHALAARPPSDAPTADRTSWDGHFGGDTAGHTREGHHA